MKIGILTYHSVYNFGANLQAYSTVSYLRNHGHDPVIINWVPYELEQGYDRNNPLEQAQAHKEFISGNLPLTRLCRTDEDIAHVIDENNINAIIIGSDAVLQHHTLLSRLRITKKGIAVKERRSNTIFPNPFWGSFIPKLKKNCPVAVMSASSQNTRYKQIRGHLRKMIAHSINRFTVVTVRDTWTQKMISYLTNGVIKPEISPDPVFGFNYNVGDAIKREDILKKFDLPENYILLSFKNKGVVTEKWLAAIGDLAEKKGLFPVILTMPGGIVFRNPPLRTISPPLSPMDWYNLIRYSSGYIGENMHPVVVAIHNVVPFFSFDDYGIINFKYFVRETSSKIYDLLAKGGFLQNRITTLGKNYRMPEPLKVIEGITNFDIDQCRSFSEKQLQKYLEMMKIILRF